MTRIDKRARALGFRRRLDRAMTERGMNQSALARAVGVDRSTISQLLARETARLPNAQVVAECAGTLGVSADWLLGLSDRPEQAADLLAGSMEMPAARRAHADEQLAAWHEEARGYKIRHVPTRLPDMLKTTELLRWEYEPHLGRTTDQAIGASGDRLALLRDTASDHEIAIPLFEIESLVRREGYYRSVPNDVRDAQIARLLELHDLHYPNLRIFLFDARRLHSAPLTVFGPLLAALHLGQSYIVFRDTERVSALARHFDLLVREAFVTPREFPDYVDGLQGAGGCGVGTIRDTS